MKEENSHFNSTKFLLKVKPVFLDEERKMKKIGLLFVLVAFVLSCLFGSIAYAQEYTIGLSFPSLSFAWFAFLEQAVKDKASQLGVNVISLEANNEVSKQISIIEDMIIRQVEGVLLVPIEVEAVVPGVEALNNANIPVVTVDRRLKEGVQVQVLAHVGADNYTGGQKAAEYIIAELSKKYG